LSDRYGRNTVLIATLIVWGSVFCGFTLADSIWVFMTLNLLNGLCRSFMAPTNQALLADLTPPEKRMRIFSIHYVALNIGAAVGPLIGAYLAFVSTAIPFLITGFTFIVYAFALMWILRLRAGAASSGKMLEKTKFKEVVKVMRQDLALGYFVIAGILVNIGYAQMDTNLPLLMKKQLGNDNMFPYLIALNAIMV
jgi:MFS family permease